ncbi:MAG: hypothetical protein ABIP51_08595, partial [Bacteroidia bacterium]
MLILFAILYSGEMKAQFPNYECKNAAASASGCYFNVTDSLSSLYIPNSSMPTLYFRINFTFLLHPTIPTAFSYVSQSQIVSDLNAYVTLMNKKFDSCGYIPSFLTPTNPSPSFPVANSKIQLVLNNVYFHTTPMAIGANEQGNILAAFPHGLDSCVNFYSYTDTLLYQYQTAGGGFIFQMLHINDVYTAGGFIANSGGPNTIWHELGHAIGNLGDHYNNSSFSSAPNNSDPAASNAPIYIPDDAAVDVAGNWNCSSPFNISTNPKTNNMMGGTGCRQHLSPRQIAAFHYLVAKNITRKFTQYKNSTYPYLPSVFSNTLTGSQSLVEVPPFSTLYIKTGANIYIHNTTIFTNQNARIIIEPGAKLTLNCVKIVP